MKNIILTLLIALLLPLTGIAQVENSQINPINASIEDLMKLIPEGLTFLPDIAYREGSDAWKLDLIMPENIGDDPRPALIFVHGGGWRNGDKRIRNFFMPCIDYALKGYVCVTVNYRLFGEADGIDDCIADVKCAVRWLRANAEKYNIDPERFGAYGNSAGAHLVSILGLCPKSAGMEGDGPYQEYSSMVQAVVSSATPANFMIPMNDRARREQEQPQSTAQQTTESRIDISEEMKKKISPITYVNADAPPFILVHDVSDPLVGIYQTDEFVKALKEAGAKDVTYKRYDDGSGHAVFSKNSEETGPMMEAFFDRVLKK
jgi:acetyl esterase/lipase